MGGRINQILKPVSGKQRVGQDVHAGRNLLELGQVFQSHVKQFRLPDTGPKIDNGKRTLPIPGKINFIPITEQSKYLSVVSLRHKSGGSQIECGFLKMALPFCQDPYMNHVAVTVPVPGYLWVVSGIFQPA